MAKGLLRFFGLISIVIGFASLGLGVLTGVGFLIILPWSVGLLLAGAPLLGFAYVIELLEDIAKNTAPKQQASQNSEHPFPATNSITPLPPIR